MNLAARFLAVAALLSSFDAVADDERRNPFRQPAFLTEPALAAPLPGSPGDAVLLLTAIVVAGDDSLVNVSGTVVGVGEEVLGYVLQSVDEETAVFSRGDETLAVSLFESGDRDED